MRMWIIPHQVKHWQICFFNWVLSSSETQLSQFDCETHGLGCQLTVSQFNLQISCWIIKSWNFLTVPVQIVLFQKICLHNERNENLILGGNLGPISTFILMKHRIAKMKQTQKQTQNGYSPSYGCGYLWSGISNWHRDFGALAFEEEKIAILFFLKKLILEISRFEVPTFMFLGAFFIPSRSLYLVTALNKNMMIFNQVS